MEVCKEDGAVLFSVVSSGRTRGSNHRLNNSNFHLNTRKKFFTVRMRLESPSVEVFKALLGMVLGSLL